MIEYEVPATHYLGLAVERALDIATAQGEPVKFEFNGIWCVAHPGGDAWEIERAYIVACDLRAQVVQLEQLLKKFEDTNEVKDWHAHKSQELAAALERCRKP